MLHCKNMWWMLLSVDSYAIRSLVVLAPCFTCLSFIAYLVRYRRR